jgi:aspartate/methionine/tyrosine aminotransferase
MFSRRANWSAPPNRLALARAAHRGELLDLTESNPTKADLDYPLDELADVMARAARARYDPQPLGLFSAREAVAQEQGCNPTDIVITASTSEAYSFLFKLLTDPGDAILTATPSYPLLEHLAALELVHLRSFALEFHRRWEIDPHAVRAAIDGRTRAIVVVHPNNPTGSYVSPSEQEALTAIGLPIVSDEVFHDFALGAKPPSFGTFSLGGLSKSAGLPHYKLGWIRLRGEKKEEALAALELIADNFLSVATPVQAALPELLRIAPRIRGAIRQRTRTNLATLHEAVANKPEIQLLPIEGGWTAVLRVPRLMTDEELALHLLEQHHVLIHPGYFFDFPDDGYLVISLLTRPDIFNAGVAKLITNH